MSVARVLNSTYHVLVCFKREVMAKNVVAVAPRIIKLAVRLSDLVT